MGSDWTASGSPRPSGEEGGSIVDLATELLARELAVPPLDPSSGFAVGNSPTREQPSLPAWLVQGGPAQALMDTLLRLLGSSQAAGPLATTQFAPTGLQLPAAENQICRATTRTRPGEAVELTVGLANDDLERPAQIELFCTELLAGPDRCISRDQVTLLPPRLEIPPGGSADVVVRISVPPGAAGTYGGLLQGVGRSQLQALVSVRVD
jgi:hypothetical protein